MNIPSPIEPHSGQSKAKLARGRVKHGNHGFEPEHDSSPPDLAPEKHARSVQANSPPRKDVTKFRLKSPEAEIVKLAADFTGWDKRSLDLVRLEGGTWEITVQLPPGRYAYRFLVDGEWHDDPECRQSEANPFGTVNGVVEVG